MPLKPAHRTVTDREALVPTVPLRFAGRDVRTLRALASGLSLRRVCAHWMAPCMPASAA